jgi:cytosine/adenosine deaminase-related metal-dependent hydrolase
LTARVLRARAIWPRPGALPTSTGASIDGGGVVLAAGRIARLLPTPAAVRRAARESRVLDLGDVLLAPGLIDAHAHLELSGLEGAIPAGTAFGAWVGELLRLRSARGAARLAADAARGAERLLRSGVTTVGDIDTTGAGERGLAGAALRVVLYREALDAHDPARTAAALERLSRARPRRARQSAGLAPHAPFTVSPALLAGLARLAARRALPVSIHWSETADEVRWMTRGSGPLSPLLGASPRRSGLDLLEGAGLLGPRLALVHGNHPARGEIARIAASGAVLVHCPGTHAYFGREPAPLGRYRKAGVPLALGTDSLASNSALDLRHEMRLLLAAHPEIAPGEAWAMGTVQAARALGLAGQVGELVPRARADLVAFGPFAGDAGEAAEALLWGGLDAEAVWVDGRRVSLPREP